MIFYRFEGYYMHSKLRSSKNKSQPNRFWDSIKCCLTWQIIRWPTTRFVKKVTEDSVALQQKHVSMPTTVNIKTRMGFKDISHVYIYIYTLSRFSYQICDKKPQENSVEPLLANRENTWKPDINWRRSSGQTGLCPPVSLMVQESHQARPCHP